MLCCTAPAMVASVASCAHCGKQGVGFKHCSVCKQASYCGAECQKANWKGHKKTCSPLVTVNDVCAKVNAANAAGDWRGVLKWEGRMEEMMAGQPNEVCLGTLSVFAAAHQSGFDATASDDHSRSLVGLEARMASLNGEATSAGS